MLEKNSPAVIEEKTTKNEEKNLPFKFPPKSLWDVFCSLKEEEFLTLIKLEILREKDGGAFIKEIQKKEYRWLFEKGFLTKKIKLGFSIQYWQKINRLGAFLRSRPEYATSAIVDLMRQSKVLKPFSSIVVFKESSSGVKVPLVAGSGYHLRAREAALQKMEEIYYNNLNSLLRIQRSLIKEIEKRTKRKRGDSSELEKVNLKELSQITLRISAILDDFRKKKTNEILIKFDVANSRREDYWLKYNQYIERNQKSSQ
jgi:hypothetical protein